MVGSSAKAPPPPVYMPAPPAPQYTPPPNYQNMVPQVKSGSTIATEGLGIETQLPSYLQLREDPLDPTVLKRYEDNYFANNINPQLAAAEAQVGANGQQYSSYGGGLVGQLRAQGELDKFSAGLAASQQSYSNLLAGRQSLFNGGIGLAQSQNNADVSRGLGIAGLYGQANQGENSFNAGIYGSQAQGSQYQNQFNQANYANAMQAIQMQNQQKYNQAMGVASLGLGAFQLGGGALSKGISGMFGGGGGGFSGGGGFGSAGAQSAIGGIR